MDRFPLSESALSRAWKRVQPAVDRFQLPFRSVAQPGMSGTWLGSGVGSSIDYQDHRPYLPGDDPRYIDWQAYARSGSYIMKLYRDEVTPKVDLVIDLSTSMELEDPKSERTLDLLYFSLLSAVRSQSSVRCFFISNGSPLPVSVENLVSFRLSSAEQAPDSGATFADGLHRIPFRSGSLRVIISDLLFPGLPDSLAMRISGSRSQVVIFAPFLASEAAPPWLGNIELRDCETGESRRQIVDTFLLDRYQTAYLRHFQLWEDAAHRYGLRFLRLPCEPKLEQSFAASAEKSGAIEPCL